MPVNRFGRRCQTKFGHVWPRVISVVVVWRFGWGASFVYVCMHYLRTSLATLFVLTWAAHHHRHRTWGA